MNVKESAKRAVKWGLQSFETVKVQLAKLKETVEDITAEAKAELAEAPAAAEAAVPAEKPAPRAQAEKANGHAKAEKGNGRAAHA